MIDGDAGWGMWAFVYGLVFGSGILLATFERVQKIESKRLRVVMKSLYALVIAGFVFGTMAYMIINRPQG